MECEMPKVNSDGDQIKKILQETKTIAVVGLSPDPSKDSYGVSAYLQSVGYKIIPIYPKEDTILGEKVYRSLDEVPGPVDMVDVFRKPEAVDEVVDQILKRKDVKALWLQLGIINNAAAKRAQDHGVQVVQNRCTKVEHYRYF